MRPISAATRSLSLIQWLAVWIFFLTFGTGAQAQSEPLRLLSISPATDHQQTSLRFEFSGPAPKPSVFMTQKPARLTITLPNTVPALDKLHRRIDTKPIQSVTTTSADNHSQVVVKLTQAVVYTIQHRGDELIFRLGRVNPSSNIARNPKPENSITDIDFRRGTQGAGRVEITLSDKHAPFEITRKNDRVIAEISNVELPRHLARDLDVTDFATPVKTIDAVPEGNNTRIVITSRPKAAFQQLAYQNGNHLYIELQPQNTADEKRHGRKHPQYTGKKISLSFQDIALRSVLQIIADVADVNIVVSDSVSGSITLKLDNVPWDQVLDVILHAKGLSMTRQDNVITVAPLTEIASRRHAEAQARAASSELAPLYSKIIQINYARASDIAQILRSERTVQNQPKDSETNASPAAEPSGVGQETSLLSARGHVTVDDRTNSLLITDTRTNFNRIRDLVNQLDIPVRQVIIQARIVVANREFKRNLGVSLKAVGKQGDLNNLFTNVNHSGYSVKLPAADATTTLSTSIISDTFGLNLELSAMESENNGEIISSPRVITADGQKADIEQGREIPYQSGSSSSLSGTRVEFKKAVLKLNVTPHITPDQQVIMDLEVKQDTIGDFIPTSKGGSVPSINTRHLTTRVQIANGDTVVLGGIFERTHHDKINGVPFLSEIPLLGNLFQGTSHDHNKQELLIFVTPRILDDKPSLSSRQTTIRGKQWARN